MVRKRLIRVLSKMTIVDFENVQEFNTALELYNLLLNSGTKAKAKKVAAQVVEENFE